VGQVRRERAGLIGCPLSRLLTRLFPTPRGYRRMNDPSVLCRSFTFDVDHFGTRRSIPLRPDGASIDVTEANKEAYVREMARFVLLENVRGQTEAMLKGVYEVVEAQHLATLEPEEMEVRRRRRSM
jgi:hypothetical protein